jgi:hypothetical protein
MIPGVVVAERKFVISGNEPRALSPVESALPGTTTTTLFFSHWGRVIGRCSMEAEGAALMNSVYRILPRKDSGGRCIVDSRG